MVRHLLSMQQALGSVLCTDKRSKGTGMLGTAMTIRILLDRQHEFHGNENGPQRTGKAVNSS